jgi:hypothetical protein
MSFILRIGICSSILTLLAILPWHGTPVAWSRDTFVQELLMSLAGPVEVKDSNSLGSLDLEKLILGYRQGIKELPSEALFPGSMSFQRLQKGLVRLASLHPGTSAAGRDGIRVLDSGEALSSNGRLVGDPRRLFSSFEIQVDRANYSVKLFGMKIPQARSLLFECKAGLGSSEFPTPRGSFYIMRIFDDKPLWIPPQDREWAWGQNPSRSVYGGHMLPFFNKQPVNTGSNADEAGDGLDLIASPVKMIDAGMYRIHGTDSPWSVGSSQSHGCVRLLNSSVARLSDILKMYVGTTARGESPNGPYVNLARPVRLILY